MKVVLQKPRTARSCGSVLRRLAGAVFLLLLGSSSLSAALYAPATNYPAGTAPKGIWLGNLRGLGTSRDMVVANSGSHTVSVRLCLDNGTFGQINHYPVGPNPIAVRTANLNGDAFEDIVVANHGTNTVSVLLNLGFGANFTTATNFTVGTSPNPGPRAVTVAHLNGDTKADLLVALENENAIAVLLGLGGGNFGAATNFTVGSQPVSIYAADFSGDDLVDVLTANRGDDTLSILAGAGNGSFSPLHTIALPSGSQPSYALPGDFDEDGDLDIAVTLANSNAVRVLLNSGGSFVTAADYPVGTSPYSLLLRDLNRDGHADIVVANSGDDTIQVLLGAGDGTFEDAGTFAVGDNPAVVVGSHFNGDDAADIAVANTGSDNVSVLLYAGPLAYNVTVSVLEDVATSIPLNGQILGGGPLLFLTNSLPSNGTLSGPTTNLLYTPQPNYFGPDSFQYTTTDGSLTSAVATVTINVVPVNDAPSFSLSTNFISVMEDAATTNVPGFAYGMSPGPANESGQSLAFVLTVTNTAFFASRPYITPLGTLVFRPARNVTGSQTLAVRLRDSGGTLHGGTNLSAPQYFTIQITPNPIKPHRGMYAGLFYDTNVVAHESSGAFAFTLLPSGLFSGRIWAEGIRYGFSGAFNLSGHAQVHVPRNNTTLIVDLQLDMTNQTQTVTGTVNGGSWTATLLGDRLVFHAVTNPAPQAGKYTLVIPGNETNSLISPGGDGYGTVTVNPAGIVRISGKVGDVASFAQSTHLSQDGIWPFYAPLYATRGAVFGWLKFTNLPNADIEGEVDWIKKPFVTLYYPNGFTNRTAVLGSAYIPPSGRVIDLTNAVITFRGANLPSAVGYPALLTDTNTLYVAGAEYLRLNSPSVGRVIGLFQHPSLGVNRGLSGIALQKQKALRGFFHGTDQTGSFRFEP
ncbi:MAG: FG-GAP-like repeat-containing protein [Verrucomicrobiales bacterium]|nr:FG-GAP-like repeat-containing protein [Verrucomicrobiales bacterium]